MFGQEVLQEAAYRHAVFYLQQLKTLNELYKGGGEQSWEARTLLDHHWSQIVQGHGWAASHLHDQKAQVLCSDYPDQGTILLAARLPLAEWIEWLQIGLDAARQLDNLKAVVRHQVNLGQAYLTHTRLEQSVTVYQQALRLAREIGYRLGAARAMVGLGRVASLTPVEADAARDYLEQALAIFREVDDRQGIGWTLQNLGSVEERYGDAETAQSYVEEALEVYRRMGSQRSVASALSRLASITERQGNYALSKSYLQESLAVARELGEAAILAQALQTLGLIVSFEGDYEASQHYYEEALAVSSKGANRMQISNCLLNLGWLARAQGAFQDAIRHYERALSIYESMGYPRRIASSQIALAAVYVSLDQLDKAQHLLREALATVQQISAYDLALEGLVSCVQIKIKRGKPQDAAELLGLVGEHAASLDSDIQLKIEELRSELVGMLSEEVLNELVGLGCELTIEEAIDRQMSSD